MSNEGPLGRYRDRVNRDADDIAGFFSTRVGTITAVSVMALVAVGALVALITGWFG